MMVTQLSSRAARMLSPIRMPSPVQAMQVRLSSKFTGHWPLIWPAFSSTSVMSSTAITTNDFNSTMPRHGRIIGVLGNVNSRKLSAFSTPSSFPLPLLFFGREKRFYSFMPQSNWSKKISIPHEHQKQTIRHHATNNNNDDDDDNSQTQSLHHHGRLPKHFLSTLQSLHPQLKISTNHYDLDSHGHGESYHPSAPPDAVIYPSTAQEIVDILRLCCREVQVRIEQNDVTENDDNDNNNIAPEDEVESIVEIVSVIPYGAGTSLEGHLSFLFPTEDASSEDTNHENVENGKIAEIPLSLFDSGNINLGNNDGKKFKKVRIQRKGGISLDMSLFQSIGDVEAGDLFVKVGAGVTRNALNAALRHTGMQMMVDPGSDCTIGGMVACGASGTAAVKYGTMRENVLAVNAVLPPTTISSCSQSSANGGSPKIVHCGTTALKSSAGFDLPALFTGSEGTLGIITEVTVRLHPIPSNVIAASCAFEDLHSAAEAVAMIRMMGVPVSRCELLDETSVRAFNHSLALGGGDCIGGSINPQSDTDQQTTLQLQPMEVKPMLFLEFSGHSETGVLEDLAAAQSICTDFEGTNFLSASDEETRQALWAARHRLYYSAIALRSEGGVGGGATSRSTLVTDACVPLSSFADVLTATANDVKDFGVIGPCFGHAGDGNFHCILPMLEDDSDEYKHNVFQVNRNLIERAMSVGGTCTGEHGVGYGKKKYLKEMYGEGGIGVMDAVKKALDPWNVMNPQKIVDSDFYGGF